MSAKAVPAKGRTKVGNGVMAAWLGVAGLIVVIDQLTKIVVDGSFRYGERLSVIPGLFDLTLLYNRGAAFSFLANHDGWQRWFFTIIGFGATALIVWLLSRHGNQRLFATAITLILGGAVGNVIDRMVHGHVVDFLLFHYERWFFPAFNIADMAITMGAILLIVDELRRVRRNR